MRGDGADALGAVVGAMAEVPERMDRMEARERGRDELLKQILARLPPLLGSKSDAARACGVSLSSIDRGIASGQIAAVRIGRRVLVDLGSLKPKTEAEISAIAAKARGL